MKKISFLISVFLSFSLPAWPAVQTYHLDEVKSQVKFTGYSTGHDFWGVSKKMSGKIEIDADQKTLLKPAVLNFSIIDMQTGNTSRDHAMQHMFDYPKYKDIEFEIEKITFEGDQSYLLQGVLRIHAISKPIVIKAKALFSETHVNVNGRFTLSLTDFALKPPSVFGVFKVKPNVDIDFRSKWVKINE